MKKLLLIYFIFSALTVYAQQKLSYAYDNAGNRTSRTIILERQQAVKQRSTKAVSYEDLLADKEIKLYPNPVKVTLSVDINGYDRDLKGEYFLFDIQGKMILHKDLKAQSFQIDMSSYAVGSYLMRIVINGESTTWEIIKE